VSSAEGARAWQPSSRTAETSRQTREFVSLPLRVTNRRSIFRRFRFAGQRQEVPLPAWTLKKSFDLRVFRFALSAAGTCSTGHLDFGRDLLTSNSVEGRRGHAASLGLFCRGDGRGLRGRGFAVGFERVVLRLHFESRTSSGSPRFRSRLRRCLESQRCCRAPQFDDRFPVDDSRFRREQIRRRGL